nr:response regulator transcription factor [Stenotrophomonas rhizophila]
MHIIVADDHPVTRIGVRTFLTNAAIGSVLAEVGDVTALVDALDRHCCDVLVTELFMPGKGLPEGVRMLPFLRKRYPQLPIVVMTASQNLGLLRFAERCGVRSLLSKSDSVTELPAAIRSALCGKTYLGSSLRARSHFFDPGRDWPRPSVPLSACESRVVLQWASGLSLSKIAQFQRRRLNTVSRQKLVAMNKLCVNNEMELIEVLRSGLLDWVE